MSDVCKQDNTVKIRYNGPTGNHLVASPLRKFPHYGMHTNGDIFCVHVDDQSTVPNIFVLIEQPSAPVVVESQPNMFERGEAATAEVVDEVPVPTEEEKPARAAKPAQPEKKRQQGRKEK